MKQIAIWLKRLEENGQIPSMDEIVKWRKGSDDRLFSSEWDTRDLYTKKYAFPIITKDLIKSLVDYIGNRKVLEVGSGTGFLAKQLRGGGLSNLICTDNLSWDWDNRFIDDIENIDGGAAIEKYGTAVDVILMSWPNYATPFAYEVLKAFMKINTKEHPVEIIFIGEDIDGCTGDDKFFEMVYDERNELSFDFLDDINDSFVSFYGIHDHVYSIKQSL